MQPWILLTIAAAFSQNLRFMLQKQLKSTRLSVSGATVARFFYSAPLVGLLALGYLQSFGLSMPATQPAFWLYVITGGLAQIVGTLCVVALFSQRNFTVGLTFKKTEVIQAAIFGFLILGETISGWGMAALATGFAGLILLADRPQATGPLWQRVANRATAIGLLSGAAFAVSAVAYRGAMLAMASEDTFLRASLTLAVVTVFQSAVMLVWLRLFEPGEITRLLGAWRVAVLMGVASLVGSLCWFSAFALQSAAYVKGLGQIEILFGAAASYFWYKERSTWREITGITVLMASVLLLILAV